MNAGFIINFGNARDFWGLSKCIKCFIFSGSLGMTTSVYHVNILSKHPLRFRRRTEIKIGRLSPQKKFLGNIKSFVMKFSAINVRMSETRVLATFSHKTFFMDFNEDQRELS